MTFRPPKGTDDIVYPDSATWRDLLAAWEDISGRYGYDLVITPVFEATGLFERGVGEDTEMVQKQMFTFLDRGQRSLTLRPESTAGVVRAHLARGGKGVAKYAYSGPMFRYEQPQAGRRRQFHQVGIEYVGTPSPTADVEVIELGQRFITEAGVPNLVIRLNSLGDGVCRPGYLAALTNYLSGLPLCEDSRQRLSVNPLRVLDCKVCDPLLTDVPPIDGYLCDPCTTHYDAVKTGLDRLEVAFEEDSRLVRGLDYYTRTAFEYVASAHVAAQNAVGGGGRYDGLAEALGGPATPGVGFALGVDRIILASDRPPPAPLDAYLVADGVTPEEVLELATGLRSAGIRCDLDPDGRSVKAQFRTAERRAAPVVVMVRSGDDLEVRVVASGTKLMTGADGLAGLVRSWL